MAYSQIRTGHLSKARNDCIMTPRHVAKDMVQFFSPSGVILEPCRGDGRIFQFLPKGSLWCEIQEGRDFFSFEKKVDWVITNPPYSNIRGFFNHAMHLASDVVFLIPIWKAFGAEGFFKDLDAWGGGIKHIRRYGTGARLGFPMGNAIGAVHISKSFKRTSWSVAYED